MSVAPSLPLLQWQRQSAPPRRQAPFLPHGIVFAREEPITRRLLSSLLMEARRDQRCSLTGISSPTGPLEAVGVQGTALGRC